MPADKAAPPVGNDADTSTIYAQAVHLHKAREWAAAEGAYRQVIQADPLHADAHHMLGALLVQRHGAAMCPEARQLMQQAIQLAPANARYRHSLGRVEETAGRVTEAIDAYEHACQKAPCDVQMHMDLARMLKVADRYGRAAEVYAMVTKLDPNHPTAHYKRASALKQLGRAEAAAAGFREHLRIDPGHQQARFWLAAVTGDAAGAAAVQTHEMIAGLFDSYSDKFDEHLVQQLQYKTPQVLMDLLLGATAELDSNASRENPRWRRCVDLGCGTGLMGPLLWPHVEWLAGVDLSAGMVAKARDRGCYDELAVAELVEYLARHRRSSQAGTTEPNAAGLDCCVAADVFVYIGDLCPVLQTAAEASNSGAVFCFSTELYTLPGNLQPAALNANACTCGAMPAAKPQQASCSGRDQFSSSSQQQACACSTAFTLQATGRYAHSPEYLRWVARQTGWEVRGLEQTVIRQNAGKPIHGNLCVLELV